jgi:hypothetical protein
VPLGARTVTVSATQIFLARKALSVDHHAVTAVSVHGSRFSTDAGSQYTSIAFTDRLVDAGIDASVGSVGDAYDNALAAESQIGLYKSEPIHRHGPWRDRDHVEAATLDWVSWFNTERPTNPSTTSPRSWWKNCTTVTEPASPRPADTKRSLRKRRGGSINALAALRTPYWLGDSATRLHALASLSAHAQQLLPDAVHDAREQEHSWTEIGQLLGLTPNTAARRYRKQP